MSSRTRKMRSKSRSKSTRKSGSSWTDFVKKVYSEMKRKNPNAKLGAAMKEASRRKKQMK
jgi:hypothetical protein